jgi:carotenoid cleavage dioxygenase
MDRHHQLTTFMPVELPGPRLPHDMAITPNYTILHDFLCSTTWMLLPQADTS